MGILDIAGGGAIGMVQDELNNQRAQGNAYDAFVRGKQMTDYNRNAQLGLWQDTGYGAQVKQMKEAGLNPALMYKNGGSGGSTNLATGNAQQAPTVPSKIGEGMAMMLNNQLQKAQIENLKADSEKKAVEAKKIGGVDTTLTMTEEELKRASIPEIQSRMGVQKAEAEKLKQDAEVGKAMVPKIESETAKNTAETKTIEAMRTAEVNRMEEEVERLRTVNKYLDQKERVEIAHLQADIYKKIQDVKIEWGKLKVEQKKAQIAEWGEEMKADYPNIIDVVGRLVDRMQRGVAQVINGNQDDLKREIPK